MSDCNVIGVDKDHHASQPATLFEVLFLCQFFLQINY